MRKSETRYRELTKRLGKKVSEHVSLKDITLTGVGGVADFFYSADTPAEIIQAVSAARALELSYVIIGSGSHSLMSDYGFGGLVIANRATHITFIPGRGQVVVESGVSWPQLILAAAGQHLSGLNPLLNLPGTLGGTLATGVAAPEVSPLWALRSLTVLATDGTIAKHNSSKLLSGSHTDEVVLTATLQFVQARPDQIALEISRYEKLRRGWADRERRYLGPILSARGARRAFDLGELLATSGALNLRVGNAFFSPHRLNYIEIRGRATARELRTLVSQIYDQVASETEETLEVHVRFLGNWDEHSLVTDED